MTLTPDAKRLALDVLLPFKQLRFAWIRTPNRLHVMRVNEWDTKLAKMS